MRELRGWGEIASVLDVHPRTCQRYLRKGLPARRGIGGIRANESELLAWYRKFTREQEGKR